MPTKATPKMSLKLLINKKDDKVVFAEAEYDFIDFLFNLLTLPIGTIVSLLPKENCLRNLHKSINKLEEASLLPQSVDAILRFFDLPLSSSDRHVKDGLVTYMVADDLSVTPMSMTSTMALFKKYNIQEVDVLEEKVVSIEFVGALRLLHCALHSKEALTKVFLEKEETKTKEG
ncbi:hypothetical protein CK203_052966 [Vitis vinifera]|uniref:DUF674 domain-containing protein n=1 Tax=Vitis vinifera TaxID=29760 RepID=A0A438EP18_VITVI|nr:hypothetical protein CK203_111141 [Vitis vinifera]RVW75351.1 hypothetical protein CK203_052966 [Vitis vinifera]